MNPAEKVGYQITEAGEGELTRCGTDYITSRSSVCPSSMVEVKEDVRTDTLFPFVSVVK